MIHANLQNVVGIPAEAVNEDGDKEPNAIQQAADKMRLAFGSFEKGELVDVEELSKSEPCKQEQALNFPATANLPPMVQVWRTSIGHTDNVDAVQERANRILQECSALLTEILIVDKLG